MMGNDNPRLSVRRLGKRPLTILQLPGCNPAIADGRPGSCRIQSNDHRGIQPQNRIEIVADDLFVKLMWIGKPFEHTVQRHIVVSGDNKRRDAGKSIKKLFRRNELVTAGTLSQVATNDDRVGRQLVSASQRFLCHLPDQRGTKMQIGYVKDRQFRTFV